GNLGKVAAEQKDFLLARSLYSQGLLLSQQLGLKKPIPEFLSSFASLHSRQGQLERAARLYGAAQALCVSLGTSLENKDDNLTTLHESFEEAAFTDAFENGRAMTLEQAIAYALDPLDTSVEG